MHPWILPSNGCSLIGAALKRYINTWGQLWLTLQAIEQNGWTITMPDAARDLIEAVYSSEAQSGYPQVLENASLDTEGKQWAEVPPGENQPA